MILVIDNVIGDGRLAGEIVRLLPDARAHAYPDEGDPGLEGVDGIVIGGSEAGVYEEPDRPWITAQKEFIREVIEDRIPTLGVCFGHQIVNAALGGEVEHSGEKRRRLVRADLAEDPLFEGVTPVVPVLHSDIVTEPGDGLRVTGSTDYSQHFATRHVDAPVWTVQYHPEFTPHVLPHYEDSWQETDLSFEDSTATRTLSNFHRLVAEPRQRGNTHRRPVE